MGLTRLLWHLKTDFLFKIITRKKSTQGIREEKVIGFEVKNRKTKISVNKETIAALERISLVDFDNQGGIEKLEAAISFADPLKEIEIDLTVQPMYSVLEKENLFLREDKVSDSNCREKVLANAQILEEEYFVAPPGNIPRKT